MASLGDVRDSLLAAAAEAQELIGTSCPRVHSPSPLEFARDFVHQNRPCVITGAMDDWPAMSKWTDDYLLERLAELELSINVTPNGRGDAVAYHHDKEVFVMPEERTMSFADFLENLRGSRSLGGGDVFYLSHQNDNLRAAAPGKAPRRRSCICTACRRGARARPGRGQLLDGGRRERSRRCTRTTTRTFTASCAAPSTSRSSRPRLSPSSTRPRSSRACTPSPAGSGAWRRLPTRRRARARGSLWTPARQDPGRFPLFARRCGDARHRPARFRAPPLLRWARHPRRAPAASPAASTRRLSPAPRRRAPVPPRHVVPPGTCPTPPRSPSLPY